MWTFANIGKEVSKVVPSWVDFDAAPAVIFIAFIIWIAAAFVHATPNSVVRITSSLRSIAVGKTSTFFCDAATRFYMAAFKIGYTHSVKIIAIALAKPAYTTPSIFADRSKRDQSTKTLASDINSFGHRAAPIGSRSSGGVDVEASASLRTIARGQSRAHY